MDAEVIMIKPMSVFIDFHGDEAVLLTAVTEVLGRSFAREDRDAGRLYRCRILDTEFVLFDNHGLDDDCGIRFTAYNYQLDLQAFETGMRIPSYGRMYESIAVFLAERLCIHLGSRSLVVANLQSEVATFVP
jgi:hypothetical protein